MRSGLLLILGLMVGLAGSNWLSAQQSRPYAVVSQQDRYEIEQLVKGYTHGVDVGPEDGSWVYTADGEFFSTNTRRITKGEKALKEMYSRLRKSNETRPVNHLLTNLIVTPTADGATGTVYLTELQRDDKNKSMPMILRFGRYHDTYVRTPQGWRIKRREFHQIAPDPALGQ
jgi:dipeptidyl aminopeptidase/acylaminoacyl peptidase